MNPLEPERDFPSRPAGLTPEERYQRDPIFHALVECLLAELIRADFTPTELREAVILAATIHELRIARACGGRYRP